MPKYPADFTMEYANKSMTKALKIYSLCLHNYLGSFFSLLQHIRKAKSNIDNPQIATEYDNEKKKYAIIELHFLQDLSDYSRHNELPMSGQNTGLFYGTHDQPKDSSIPSMISLCPPSLLIPKLLEDKKLSAKSNAYLNHYIEQQGAELILPQIIDKGHSSLRQSALLLYRKKLLSSKRSSARSRAGYFISGNGRLTVT